jgi:hypothetical protein
MRRVRVGVSETAVGRPPHAAGGVSCSAHPIPFGAASSIRVADSPLIRLYAFLHAHESSSSYVCVAASLGSCRRPKLNKTPGHAVAVHRMMYLNQILVADLSCFPYRVKCMGCHHLSPSKKAARLGYGGEHFGPSNSNPTGIGWAPTV